MNPAFRIWAFSLLLIFIVALIAVGWGGEPGFSLIIAGMAAAGSVMSLAGFYLMFMCLDALWCGKVLYWTFSLLGIVLIVCANIYVFLAVINVFFGLHSDIEKLFTEMWPLTAIAAGAALTGAGLSYKKVNACFHQKSDAQAS